MKADLTKAPGLCKRCDAPAKPGRLQCEAHLAEDREAAKRYYAANLEKVRARMRAFAVQYRIDHKEELRPENRLRLRERYAKWKRDGRCPACGGAPLPGKKMCGACCEYAREKRRRRSEEGRCHRCGRAVGVAYCPPCRAYLAGTKALRRARQFGANRERVSPAAVFARDGWRCMICGRKTPKSRKGTQHDNAPELDHRVPLSRGGSHTYENVQCACRACNVNKGNRTEAGQIPLWSRPAA